MNYAFDDFLAVCNALWYVLAALPAPALQPSENAAERRSIGLLSCAANPARNNKRMADEIGSAGDANCANISSAFARSPGKRSGITFVFGFDPDFVPDIGIAKTIMSGLERWIKNWWRIANSYTPVGTRVSCAHLTGGV
jgi:hypothetical protein